MTPAPKRRLRIEPFKPSDFPILWEWVEAAWQQEADDFFPRNKQAYIELHAKRMTEFFTVYLDGVACAVFSAIAVLPFAWECHVTFRPGALTFIERKEILRAGIRFAWRCGCKTIICLVFPENRFIIRLLGRLGAEFEGRLRNRTVKNEKVTDLLSFSILREE